MEGVVMSDANSNVKTAPCFGTEWDGSHPDCMRCFLAVFDACRIKTKKYREDKDTELKSEQKKLPLDIVIDALRDKFDYNMKETKQAQVHYFKRDGKGIFIIAFQKKSKKVRFQTPKSVYQFNKLESVNQIESILKEIAIENK